MDSVGIRDLRQRASELVRRVEAGETIEVTDRGRPVARLGPIAKKGTMLEQLRAAGETSGRSKGLKGLPPPLRPKRGADLPSQVLARLRRDER
jgi:prevent-host-death family protein